MKKLLLMLVAATGIFVACEKDEFEALNELTAQNIARLDAADDVLQSNIDDLRSDFDAFVEDINERLASAVAALEAADEALEDLINAGLAELNEKLEKAVLALTASIEENTDLIKAVSVELKAKIKAEASARLAGDLLVANELADQVSKLESKDSLLMRNIGRNAASIGSVNSRLSAEVSRLNSVDAQLAGQISSTISTLNTAVSNIEDLEDDIDSNSLDIDGLRTDLTALSGRVDALPVTSITQSGTILTVSIAHEGNTHVYTIDQTGGADGTGTDGADLTITSSNFDNGILTLTFSDGTTITSEDLTGPQGEAGPRGPEGPEGPAGADGSASGDISVTWDNPFVDQTADFTQTATLNGATLSREIAVVAGSPVDVLGATTITVTYDGLASLSEAQAAYTAVGTHTIAVITTTVVADGVRSIEYTATADNGAVAIGSHTVTSVIAGSSNSVNSSEEYVVAPLAPYFSSTNNIPVDDVVAGGVYTVSFNTNRENIFLVSAGAQEARLLTPAELAAGSFTLTAVAPNNFVDAIFSFRLSVDTIDGAQLDFFQTGYRQPSNPADTLSAWSEWIGTAPAATIEYGQFGAWDEQFAPAARIELGTPVITLGTAASNVASVTEKTTTSRVSIVDAYPRARSRSAVSVVAAYDQTRTRTIIVNGAEDATPPVGELSETRTISETRTVLADDVQGETVPESRTALEDIVTTRMVANPAYVAPTGQGTGEDATDPGNGGGITIGEGTTAVWTADAGVYTNPNHPGVSFTNVQLGRVIAFVAPNGVATADLTLADGTVQSVQTADGDDTLADLIAFIATLL